MTAVDADFEARTYAKVSRRLLPFLFLCYILGQQPGDMIRVLVGDNNQGT